MEPSDKTGLMLKHECLNCGDCHQKMMLLSCYATFEWNYADCYFGEPGLVDGYYNESAIVKY